MLTIVLALFFGTFSGTLAGGLLSWLLNQPPNATRPVEPFPIDPDVDARIDRAASQWATANDQPGAAPLAADKLKLAYVLNQRVMERHSRRWSR
jgi:hypothetical protein